RSVGPSLKRQRREALQPRTTSPWKPDYMTVRESAARPRVAAIKKWEFPHKCPQDTILRTKGIPMKQIVLNVRRSVKDRLLRSLRRIGNAGTRLRYLMIVNVINGRSTRQTAKVLGVHHTTVGRAVQRFRQYGEARLHDGRADNGEEKLSEGYLQRRHTLVSNA